jgi:hypothetical protein
MSHGIIVRNGIRHIVDEHGHDDGDVDDSEDYDGAPPPPATHPHTGLERTLKAAILVRLSQLGCFAWNNPTGVATPLGQKHAVRYGNPGAPDVLALVRGGRLLAVECKSARGRQRPEQRAWQARCEAMGAVYVLARSVSDVEIALRDILHLASR